MLSANKYRMLSNIPRNIWTLSKSQNSNKEDSSKMSIDVKVGWNLTPRLPQQRGEKIIETVTHKMVITTSGMFGLNPRLPSLSSDPVKNKLYKYEKKYPSLNVKYPKPNNISINYENSNKLHISTDITHIERTKLNKLGEINVPTGTQPLYTEAGKQISSLETLSIDKNVNNDKVKDCENKNHIINEKDVSSVTKKEKSYRKANFKSPSANKLNINKNINRKLGNIDNSSKNKKIIKKEEGNKRLYNLSNKKKISDADFNRVNMNTKQNKTNKLKMTPENKINIKNEVIKNESKPESNDVNSINRPKTENSESLIEENNVMSSKESEIKKLHNIKNADTNNDKVSVDKINKRLDSFKRKSNDCSYSVKYRSEIKDENKKSDSTRKTKLIIERDEKKTD